MENDNFSPKEILLQLMSKMDAVSTAVNKQELLLNSIHEASASRDEKIRDLKLEVKTLQEDVVKLTTKVQSLKAFNRNIVGIWSALILFISIFGRDILYRLFA